MLRVVGPICFVVAPALYGELQLKPFTYHTGRSRTSTFRLTETYFQVTMSNTIVVHRYVSLLTRTVVEVLLRLGKWYLYAYFTACR